MSKLAGEELQKLHGASVWLWVLIQINNDDGDMMVCSSDIVGASDLAVVKVLASELTKNVDAPLHD